MESSTMTSAGSQAPQSVGLNDTGMYEEKPPAGSQPPQAVGQNDIGVHEEKPTAGSQPPQAVGVNGTGLYKENLTAGSQPPQVVGLTVTGVCEKKPTTLVLHGALNPKEKRKREHEERVRMQQEAKREAQEAKRLKQQQMLQQQAEEKAKRKEKEAAAAQKLVEVHRLERRDRELREAVVEISPQCLSKVLASTFQTYGEIESVKMDKFASSFIIRFANKEAAQKAIAQPPQVVEGGQLDMTVSKQLVKAHCCFMPQIVSEDTKRNYSAFAEKLRPVVEAVGPVDHIDIVKGHAVIMFKDMESAERAIVVDPPLQMDGRSLHFLPGLPKRVGSGDPQCN